MLRTQLQEAFRSEGPPPLGAGAHFRKAIFPRANAIGPVDAARHTGHGSIGNGGRGRVKQRGTRDLPPPPFRLLFAAAACAMAVLFAVACTRDTSSLGACDIGGDRWLADEASVAGSDAFSEDAESGVDGTESWPRHGRRVLSATLMAWQEQCSAQGAIAVGRNELARVLRALRTCFAPGNENRSMGRCSPRLELELSFEGGAVERFAIACEEGEVTDCEVRLVGVGGSRRCPDVCVSVMRLGWPACCSEAWCDWGAEACCGVGVPGTWDDARRTCVCPNR